MNKNTAIRKQCCLIVLTHAEKGTTIVALTNVKFRVVPEDSIIIEGNAPLGRQVGHDAFALLNSCMQRKHLWKFAGLARG